MRASVVIAAYNEGDALGKTVRSVVESCAGLDHEIVIADDASWDGSVEELTRRFPHVRVVRHEERRGTSPTKDLGARNARGEVLVFLDGHCKPELGSIARLVEDVEALRGEAIVTPTIPALDVERWKNQPSQVGHGYFLDLEKFGCGWLPLSELRPAREGRLRLYESPALIGCVLAVSRELYDALWGFDPHMRLWGVEDLDLGLRCWLMGHRILHDPEAVVGHRFREAFDYAAPLEQVLANQLRMARKNFTDRVWRDWVDRCRLRHPGRLADHPEGLWTRAWSLFEADGASVEAERSYLLARRVRDEFWYAERFGLTWPRLHPAPAAAQGKTPAAIEPAAVALQASPSPPPSRRLILLFGYWPPTDIGVEGDRTFPQPPFPDKTVSGHGMLWKWREAQQNYKNSGYDVLAISPTFKEVMGYNAVGPEIIAPYWGKGEGTLTVDYRATSTDFWSIVAKYRPVAIMSFSRGFPNNSWELEQFGTNFANDQWLTTIPYLNFDGTQHEPPGTWDPPYIGGSPADPAPPSKGHKPAAGDPPDPTRPAAPDRRQPAIPVDATRDSNLPMNAIVAAVNAHFGGRLNAFVDRTGSGDFVSNFMAYQVAWYRQWWAETNKEPDKACRFSGHTHVGVFVSATDAATAVDIQLDELFKSLKG